MRQAAMRTPSGKGTLGALGSPLRHGFDVDMLTTGPGSGRTYVAPWTFKYIKENFPGNIIEDRMSEGDQWMNEVSEDKPFFMNYWMFSVHGPECQGVADREIQRRDRSE